MVQAEFILRDKSEFLFRLLEDTAHAELSDVLNYEISVMVPDGFELEARLFWRLGLGRPSAHDTSSQVVSGQQDGEIKSYDAAS
ncbi:hypothetical protein E4U22_004275, partial [Claviceps purpurea]